MAHPRTDTPTDPKPHHSKGLILFHVLETLETDEWPKPLRSPNAADLAAVALSPEQQRLLIALIPSLSSRRVDKLRADAKDLEQQGQKPTWKGGFPWSAELRVAIANRLLSDTEYLFTGVRADLANNPKLAEEYLFGNLPPQGTPEQNDAPCGELKRRAQFLLKDREYPWEEKGPAAFNAAIVAHYNSGSPQDMNDLKNIMRGYMQDMDKNNGRLRDVSDAGKAQLVVLFGMFFSDPVESLQLESQIINEGDFFDSHTNNGREFLKSITDNDQGRNAMMGVLAIYLNGAGKREGQYSLVNNPSQAGTVVGEVILMIYNKKADQIKSAQEKAEFRNFLVAASLTMAIAATGGYAAAAPAIGRIGAAAIGAATDGAEVIAGGVKPFETADGNIQTPTQLFQIQFVAAVFDSLDPKTKTFLTTPYVDSAGHQRQSLAPFVVNGKLVPPVLTNPPTPHPTRKKPDGTPDVIRPSDLDDFIAICIKVDDNNSLQPLLMKFDNGVTLTAPPAKN